ncbi:MAG TPA: MBL fold metallo-hydrolase [Thermoanaerobaculia bacterium]|jgi:L-ascorbate metabolism protein UlaG (beta-lactamase superfamily)|nr:MBL fold metallo-hydrolase [Thermoanaerobaculia bacterium]
MRYRPAILLILTVAVLACVACGCGHVIRGELAPNHFGRDFDFRHPGCAPAPRPAAKPDDVLVRYLGAGGLYLEWRGVSLLTSPFFSNPGRFRAPFGRLSANRVRIDGGLKGMDLQDVRAILVGHSHYDHLADVPMVAENFCRKARIYVNRSGANVLAGLGPLRGRVDCLEDPRQEPWIRLQDDAGRDLPVRFRAVETVHAPLFWHLPWSPGEVKKAWDKGWDGRRFRQLRVGKPFAFVIDLLDSEGKPRFRIYYQDAASPENKGYPEIGDGVPYDLAVLCMASFRYVKNHPGGLLGNLQPRHVLVTHYEDFFRDPQKPLRFVPLLTGRLADEFLVRVRTSLAGIETIAPLDPVCGPSGPTATMPLPGEWVRFQPREVQP